eukprot:3552147-Prymnesium_polylepis.1
MPALAEAHRSYFTLATTNAYVLHAPQGSPRGTHISHWVSRSAIAQTYIAATLRHMRARTQQGSWNLWKLCAGASSRRGHQRAAAALSSKLNPRCRGAHCTFQKAGTKSGGRKYGMKLSKRIVTRITLGRPASAAAHSVSCHAATVSAHYRGTHAQAGAGHTPGERRDDSVKARLDADQLTVEVEVRLGRDGPGAVLTVPEVIRDLKLALPADAHATNALVPARDHLARTERECKGRTTLCAVKLARDTEACHETRHPTADEAL